jgi:hypothetical protein
MIWLLPLAIVLIVCGLLLTPMIIGIDTRVPELTFRWKGIGNAAIHYESEEWLLRFRIVFYKREIKLRTLKRRKGKRKKAKRAKRRPQRMIRKFFAVGKTFRVPVWKISLDTGDYTHNALLYPLNHFIGRDHCNINFLGENHLVLELRNNLGRMLYAWIR